MTAPKLTAYAQGQTVVSGDRANTMIQSCNVIEQLRGFVGLPGIEVLARGQFAINDGSGGLFYWDSTATGPDDGINVIVPTGTAIGAWIRNNLGTGGTTVPIDIVLTWTGPQTVATTWLGGEKFTRAITLPMNCTGSQGLVPKTLPTGSYVVTMKKDGVTIGTATCSTGGAWTFSTASTTSFAISDYLDFYGAGDATIADFGLTLAATTS